MHRRQPFHCHVRQQVPVAFHQRRLGNDGDGMTGLGQDSQDGAGEAEPPFDRLVAVGTGAERQGGGGVPAASEFPPEELHRIRKDGEAGEDEVGRAEKDLDKTTHQYTTQIEELVKHKEGELLEV